MNARLMVCRSLIAAAAWPAGVRCQEAIDPVPAERLGFAGRAEKAHARVVVSRGGTGQSERAVELGLAWIAKRQKPDGGWQYDARDGETRRISATGLGVLPFLGAGHTHKQGRYKTTARRGLEYLMRRVLRTGAFRDGNKSHYMYEHGIATLALCEGYGLSKDRLARG